MIRYEKTTFGDLKAGDWYRLPNCDHLAYLKPEGYAGFPTQEVYRLILPPDAETLKVLEACIEKIRTMHYQLLAKDYPDTNDDFGTELSKVLDQDAQLDVAIIKLSRLKGGK